MARGFKTQTLALCANGTYVGRWTVSARGDMELQYDPAWRASAVGRPLSLSLPFGLGDEPLKGPAVEHYFDNLLPDSLAIRKRVRWLSCAGCALAAEISRSYRFRASARVVRSDSARDTKMPRSISDSSTRAQASASDRLSKVRYCGG